MENKSERRKEKGGVCVYGWVIILISKSKQKVGQVIFLKIEKDAKKAKCEGDNSGEKKKKG